MKFSSEKGFEMYDLDLSPCEMIKSKINELESMKDNLFDEIDLMDCITPDNDSSCKNEEFKTIPKFQEDKTNKKYINRNQLSSNSLKDVNSLDFTVGKPLEENKNQCWISNVSKISKLYMSDKDITYSTGENKISTKTKEDLSHDCFKSEFNLWQKESKNVDVNFSKEFILEDCNNVKDPGILVQKVDLHHEKISGSKEETNNQKLESYEGKIMSTLSNSGKVKKNKKQAKSKKEKKGNKTKRIRSDYKKSLIQVIELLSKWMKAMQRIKIDRKGRPKKNNATEAALEENLQKKTMDYYKLQLNKAITLGQDEIQLELYLGQSFGILSNLVKNIIQQKSEEEKKKLKSKYRTKEIRNKFKEFVEKYRGFN